MDNKDIIAFLAKEGSSDVSPADVVTATGQMTPAQADRTRENLGAAAEESVVTQAAPATLTLADNTMYYLTGVTELAITYPSLAHWEVWIRLTTAASGAIDISLPTSSYIGGAPTIGNGETWELSIRDGVVVAGKVETPSA